MRSIDEALRRRLFALSATLSAVAFGLFPLAARSSLDLARERAAYELRFAEPPVPQSVSAAPLVIARDPFAGDASAERSPKAALPAVSAIASGTSPHALLDEGGGVRLIGIGDPIGGSVVTSIQPGRVGLADGRFMLLGGGTP